MARPTKYSDSLIKKAKLYVTNFADNGDVIPSIEGLSEHLVIARSTIYEWAKQEGKKEFSDILEQILTKQARLLINESLKGEFNAAIAKLALGKHGYSEKVEADVTTGGEKLSNTFTFIPVGPND